MSDVSFTQADPSTVAGQRGYCESAGLVQAAGAPFGSTNRGARLVPSNVSPAGGASPASSVVVG